MTHPMSPDTDKLLELAKALEAFETERDDPLNAGLRFTDKDKAAYLARRAYIAEVYYDNNHRNVIKLFNIISNLQSELTTLKAQVDSAFNEGVEAAAKYHIDMAELWEKAARYADTENDITRKDQSTNESGAHRTHARRILALTRPTPAQSENRDE